MVQCTGAEVNLGIVGKGGGRHVRGFLLQLRNVSFALTCALTKLSILPKISSTVATTSKHRSSSSPVPPPAPATSLPAELLFTISFLTSLTNSCTLSLPAPPESRLRVGPPPIDTGPADEDVV